MTKRLIVTHVKITNTKWPYLTRELDLPIDESAVLSLLTQEILVQLEIAALSQRLFMRRDGHRITRRIGSVWMEIEGRTEIVPVAFAGPGDTPLIGMISMQILCMRVKNGQIEKYDAYECVDIQT